MVIILAFQNSTLEGKHGLFEELESPRVHILAEHTGLGPSYPYNHYFTLRLNKINETL